MKLTSTCKIVALFAVLYYWPCIMCAQGHILGFGSMDGGVENQIVGTTPNVSGTSLSTGTQQSAYTTAQSSSSVGNISSIGARTGGKCLTWTSSSTSNLLWSPTAANGAIQNATSYVVQFHYTYASGSARAFVVGLGTDGTAGAGTATTSSLPVASTYTKVSLVVTTGTSSATPKYGMLSLKPSGGSFSTPYFLDDIVVYPGTAEDNTAPAAATNVVVTNASPTSLNVSFTAPAGGVDGGGYVVVRGTTDPTTSPNANGIYAIGNSMGTGTVAYIGTNTSFTDVGLNTNTTYFYRVYAVDKAFNYATAATGNGFTGITPIIFGAAQAYKQNNQIQVSWKTITEIDAQSFEVEKSNDGINYFTIATVPAQGRASSYTAFDAQIMANTVYYRIKGLEKNGTFCYSPVFVYKANTEVKIRVINNPIRNGFLQVHFQSMLTDTYTLHVTDVNGKMLLQRQLYLSNNSSNYWFNLPPSYKGPAWVKISNGSTVVIQQILLQ